MTNPNLWMNEFHRRHQRLLREVSGDQLAGRSPKEGRAFRDLWTAGREILRVFQTGKPQHALADIDVASVRYLVPDGDIGSSADESRELAGQAISSKR